jgi:tellurite resistance protein TehA-like permease
MEKKKVFIGNDDGGVKILNLFGILLFVLGAIFALVVIIGLIIMFLANISEFSRDEENSKIGLSLASSFFSITIGTLIAGAICKGLSSIAKTALYSRVILEQKNEFLEGTENDYKIRE